MYHPIIKNKLNEIKGLNAVDNTQNFMPIIEMVDIRYGDVNNFEKFTSKLENILKVKSVYIDLPTYCDNEILEDFTLNNAETKYHFFIELQKHFESKDLKSFIPVVSFDYSYGSQRESYKENMKFSKKIISHFNEFAIRLFSDSSFKTNDIDLITQIYVFLGDDIQDKCTIIVDTDLHTTNEVIPTIEEISQDYKLKKLVIAGEAFETQNKTKTEYACNRIRNHHLRRYEHLKEVLKTKNILETEIDYADYTLLDKIQSKIEVDVEKGFAYYPFIKYTTEDGNLCMFTADKAGSYEQYEELCQRVKEKIRKFSSSHCETCTFINDVASGVDGLKYKGGGVWKHRMIAHHITTLSMLQS